MLTGPPLINSAAVGGLTLPQAFRTTGETPPVPGAPRKEIDMLHYAIVFLVIALIAALFGFGGIAAGAVEIAKILFFVFVIMAVVAFVISIGRKG
jgi:uncharacterized membrane protein YtjA (UPF0391 family)